MKVKRSEVDEDDEKGYSMSDVEDYDSFKPLPFKFSSRIRDNANDAVDDGAAKPSFSFSVPSAHLLKQQNESEPVASPSGSKTQRDSPSEFVVAPSPKSQRDISVRHGRVGGATSKASSGQSLFKLDDLMGEGDVQVSPLQQPSSKGYDLLTQTQNLDKPMRSTAPGGHASWSELEAARHSSSSVPALPPLSSPVSPFHAASSSRFGKSSHAAGDSPSRLPILPSANARGDSQRDKTSAYAIYTGADVGASRRWNAATVIPTVDTLEVQSKATGVQHSPEVFGRAEAIPKKDIIEPVKAESGWSMSSFFQKVRGFSDLSACVNSTPALNAGDWPFARYQGQL